METALPSLLETETGPTPPQLDATTAEAQVPWSDDVRQRFEKCLRAALPPEAGDPLSITVIDLRRKPSLLREGGCLVQVKAEYAGKSLVLWCLFFDGEKDAVVVPFMDRKRSIPDVIASIEQERGQKCVLIDSETIVDYVVEVMNYELGTPAYDGAAGLLVNDLDPNSRTFGVLDWPTPLLESEKKEVKKCLSTHSVQVDADTDYSFRVEACMVERDALVWREFRIFTKNSPSGLDPGRKGQVLPGRRDPTVLVKGLPDNSRALPGASLGVPEIRHAADRGGWEPISPMDVLSIRSDLDRRIIPVLDPAHVGRWSRQHLACYDLDLLRIEPANTDEKWIAYIVWKPGFALPLPLDSTSSPIHHFNDKLGAQRRSKSGDGRVIRTKEEAADYAVFFGRHVWGDEGPFIVLKSKDDPAIVQLHLKTHGTLETNEYGSIDLALAAIAEPKAREAAREVGSSSEQAFEVFDAWVLYGKTISKVTFRVPADGSITMTNDEPMVGAPNDESTVPALVKDNAYPPCLPLGCVITESVELKPLTASDLEKKSGQSTVVENRVLTGQLTRETLHVRNFRRCRFRGRVNLRFLASDRGLSFEECVFENGLDLTGASLKGTLSITQSLLVQGRHHRLIDTAQPFSFNALSADGLLIDGLWSTGSLSAADGLLMDGRWSTGSLIASEVRIHGAVRLSELRTPGGIDLTGLAAQSFYLADTYAKEDINLEDCVIDQFMDFRNVSTDSSINLYGAVVTHNYVRFSEVSVAGDLAATFVRVGTGFFLESDVARGNTIGGSIELGAANLAKLLRIRNTRVGKSIEAKGVATAEVRILGGRLQDFKTSPDLTVAEIDRRLQELFKASPTLTVAEIDRRLQDFPPDLTVAEIDRRLQELFKASPDLTVAEISRHLQEFEASPDLTVAEIGRRLQEFNASYIGEVINLTDADIKHDVTLVDLEVGTGLDTANDATKSFLLRNAKVGGNVRLFLTAEDARAQKWLHAEAKAEPDFAGKWQRGLDLKNATILGDVNLTGVVCDGGICVEEAEIQRDLHIVGSDSSRRATATHLVMTGLKCQGVADITGLDLSADGSVIANLATFAKKLIVAKSLTESATIPGRLELSGSTIGDLAVSYSSFPFKNDDTKLKAHGIILKQARVDKLSVFRTRSHNKEECRYPQPIDLSFSEIKWWEFRNGNAAKGDNPKEEPGVSEEVKDYELLLDGDTHKQRHTFSSIEQNLFNRGLDDAADDIHVKMRRWLRRQGNDKFFGWWKNRGRSVWDLATRATTSPWRLIWAVVIWTVISALVVFSNPANIAPSEVGLTAHREWKADSVPPNTEWGWRSGVWMALHFHVPVAVLTARSAWAPASGRELTVSLPRLPKWRWAWISPEDYANFVLALHFLIWPVILIIASRKFFMRLGK